MNNDNGSSFLGFLVGFVVGGLVGAAVALLYAPQSGEETRAAISEKSIELREQANEQATAVRLKAQEKIETLQGQVIELQAKMQKQVTGGVPPVETPPAA